MRTAARRSAALLSFALVVAVAAPSAGAASLGRTTPRASGIEVSAGSVDVVAPATGSRTASIPVTLTRPAASTVRLHFALVSGTAVVGKDFVARSGALSIPAGSVEASIPITIHADATPATRACWYQQATLCRTFSVALTALSTGVTVAPAPSDDAILSPAPPASGIGAGDALVVNGTAGRARTLRVPVTLSASVIHAVSAQYAVTGGSAVAGFNFRTQHGTITFPARVTSKFVDITVLVGHSSQPSEVLYVTLTAPHGAALARSIGIGIIETAAPGVPDPLDPSYSGATLTQVVSTKTGASDGFSISPTVVQPGTVMSANGPIVGPNDRMVFWPAAETPLGDAESCATWSSQSPAQGAGVPTQEGLALRVATHDGITRAITVTKNIFANATFVLNVHVWNTSKSLPFQLVGQFNLAQLFIERGNQKLPWNVCARVVGAAVQVELWLTGDSPPAWGDTSHGGTVALPAGWDYPGDAGWYVGHLETGASATYANEYEGAPQSAPAV